MTTHIDPPAILDGEALDEWTRITALLDDAGTVELSRAAVTAYCLSWSKWTEAEKAVVETGGPVVKSPNGYPIQNPWCSIANAAYRQMLATSKALGFVGRKRKKTKTASGGLQLLGAKRA